MGKRIGLGAGVSSDRQTRAAERRKRIIANRADNFADAESWDLDFWQNCTVGERLSALVHLRRDVELARAARKVSADKRR